MPLIDVRPAALRRAILVVAFIPVFAAVVLWAAASTFVSELRELPSVFLSVWRGREGRARC